jgi:asparagine synthase (glutamine-hydrolysing)
VCGIAGLVCLTGACRGDDHERIVSRMCDLQVHRGPDDRGLAGLGRACLGTTRLSIIDLTPAGHMPMATDEGRWWIAYNGEVYNFPALRDELARRGHAFRSRTDTEVVLRAFAEWGESCLSRLVGMFALAVWDRRTETLILARDRFGKKPLYHALLDGHLLFASEMKALAPLLPEPRVNAWRLAEWSLYRTTDCGRPETLLEGISALPPGHLLRVARGRLEAPRRYYAIEARVDVGQWQRLDRAPVEAVRDEIESLLAASVCDRLVSDVPLGTLCSGGLDSGLVTALCARHRPGVTAFNVSVQGYPALDERRHAAAVARALGVDLRVYPLTADAYRASLVRAVYHSDAPLTHPNSVALLLVSEFARSHGVTILMSGEGGDELFGGYPQRYRRARQLRRVGDLLARAPARLRKALGLAGGAVLGLPVTRFTEYEGLLAHAVGFLDGYAREGLYRRCVDAYGFVPDEVARGVLAAMLADLSVFLSPLLRRLDRMSMAASVECRAPFLDHRLAEVAVNLPLRYKLRGGADKWVLKAIAERHLPRDLVHRRKVGFPLPLADYVGPLAGVEFFRGGFCEDALRLDRRALLERVAGWRHDVHTFFSLLTLEIWGRLFVARQHPDEVNEALLARAGAARPHAVGAAAGADA